jgi:hypothetical protein
MAYDPGAVTLSEPGMILLKAIAAYEQVELAAALTLALATHATKIGAGPLARAALDQIERHGASHKYLGERVDGGAGGVDACPARCADGDLHTVPEFRRSGEKRFRSGGP